MGLQKHQLRGRVYYKFLTLGILSVIGLGLFNSSSASALDGFSFSDILNQQQAQREQLLSYLANPFGMSSGCESTNPDSTISCNESLFPELLYNRITDGTKLYGHDGKGTIFADNNVIVGGNPQIGVIKPGEVLRFSAELLPERYMDDAPDRPIVSYQIMTTFSQGLQPDLTSLSIKVGDKELSSEDYSVEVLEFSGDEALLFGISSAFEIKIDWGQYDEDNHAIESFLYPEDAPILITYSAKVAPEAPAKVHSANIYAPTYYDSGQEKTDDSSESDLFSPTYKATAYTRGGIIIRRVDVNGNPVRGAKYTVDGVSASKSSTREAYEYNPKGGIKEFTTNEKGEIIIIGVPEGVYEARELYSPDGSSPGESSISRTVDLLSSDVAQYSSATVRSMFGIDSTDTAKSYEDGTILSSGLAMERIALQWDEALEAYKYGDGEILVRKEGDSYKISVSSSYENYEVNTKYDENNAEHYGLTWISDDQQRFEPLKDRTNITLSDDGKTAIVKFDAEYEFTYDAADGCYHGSLPIWSNQPLEILCKNGDYYHLKGSTEGNDLYSITHYLTYKYNETAGHYIVDAPQAIYTISQDDGDTISLSMDLAILYVPSEQTTLTLGPSDGVSRFGFKSSIVENFVPATLFLFRTGDNTPEDTPNPQTSDVVLETVVIAGIGLAPAFVLRKRLAKRP